MELNYYQDTVLGFKKHPQPYDLGCCVLGLASEAGEVAGKLGKAFRDNDGFVDSQAMVKELGDVLWYVAATANALGYTLQEVAAINIDKLMDREARGVIKGSGDNR